VITDARSALQCRKEGPWGLFLEEERPLEHGEELRCSYQFEGERRSSDRGVLRKRNPSCVEKERYWEGSGRAREEHIFPVSSNPGKGVVEAGI